MLSWAYFPAESDSEPVHLMPLYTPDNIIPWPRESRPLRDLRKDPCKHYSKTHEVANAPYSIVCKNCKSMPNIKTQAAGNRTVVCRYVELKTSSERVKSPVQPC